MGGIDSLKQYKGSLFRMVRGIVVTSNVSDKTQKLLTRSDNLFPVVGIGTSAGGLDTFKRLLKAIPESSGMAFILVQHLDPTHESILAS